MARVGVSFVFLASLVILFEGTVTYSIESRLDMVEILLHKIIKEEMADMKESLAQMRTQIQTKDRDNQDQPPELDEISKEEIQKLADEVTAKTKADKEDSQKEVNELLKNQKKEINDAIQDLSADCKADKEDLRKEVNVLLKNHKKEITDVIQDLSADKEDLRKEIINYTNDAIDQHVRALKSTIAELETMLIFLIGPCKDGWVPQLHSCILYVHNQSLNWFEAQDYCKERDSHLVEPSSAAAMDFLLKFRPEYHRWWIGARDNVGEGVWRWESTQHVIGKVAWNDGEPNNTGGNEHCLEMDINGGMNDNNCEQRRIAFICEMQKSM